jgi:hypothetical protein
MFLSSTSLDCEPTYRRTQTCVSQRQAGITSTKMSYGTQYILSATLQAYIQPRGIYVIISFGK